MTRRTQILVLVLVLLVVFLPTVFAQFCNVDDLEVITAFRKNDHWTIGRAFFRDSAKGLYYRPMVPLLYLFDKHIHAMNPVWMHLENVIFHLTNVLLFWLCADLLTRSPAIDRKLPTETPFVAALLFGLHPLVTESVNWISGRTDLIAATFLLTATFCLLYFKESRQKPLLAAAALCLFLALLAKETALAFLPGGILLLLAHDRQEHRQKQNSSSRTALLILLVFGAAVAAFLLLRHAAYTSSSSKIGLTLKIIAQDPGHAVFVVLRALGFYLKKLVLPWPLNFAIDGVDPLYELVAMPAVLFCLWLLFRLTLSAAFFLTGVLLLTPSFVIAFNQIAWMPYAERYVLLTLPFAILAAFFAANGRVARSLATPGGRIVAGIVLIMLATTTTHRNWVWQSNLRLLADTAAKTPENRTVQGIYGGLLAKDGQFDEALAVLHRAETLPILFYSPVVDNNLGDTLLAKGDLEGALNVFERAASRSRTTPAILLEGLVQTLGLLLEKVDNRADGVKYYAKLSSYSLKLYEKRKDPLILYELGKRALRAGHPAEAATYLTTARNLLSPAHPYRDFIDRLLPATKHAPAAPQEHLR